MLDENVSWRYRIKTVENKLSKTIALLCRVKQFIDETSSKTIYFSYFLVAVIRTVMRAVVLNFYMIVIIFLNLYVNKKTFCSCDSFISYIGYTSYPGNIQNDEIQDDFMSSLWAEQLKRKSSWQSFYFYFPTI